MIKEGIKKIIMAQNLSAEETEQIFSEIMQGEATPAQIAALITALHIKGETVEEITGAAKVMRKFATRIKTKKENILDTCGTGGDGKHTFNISTLAAFVACGAGITVAKHGNRGISSKCGSADLLEKLGVNISAGIDIVEKCLDEIGIGFLFAPNLHTAMKYAAGPRKEIGIRTIFNILGPLTNPAAATNQLLGVFDEKLTMPIAQVLGKLGTKHALVVHGRDGLDEVSTTAETIVCEFENGKIKKYLVRPEQFGIKRTDLKHLMLSDPDENVKIALKIFAGEDSPHQDIVLLNSAFAIYAANGAKNLKEAYEKAKISLKEGRAKEKLNLLISYTNEVNFKKNN